MDNTAIVRHTYDGFNQLISSLTGEGTITYTYNAQGIRTSRTIGLTTTHYLLDGGNVIGEVEGDAATTYLRGVNLISSNGTYYLYNAHGDVVQLTNTNGELTRNYNYDAFGNEREPDGEDVNPFRYCGEYYDTETGLYYLRARYYDPLIGRFTQEDTHWNTANMIYGDNPQKINEREDKLGLKHYSYAPGLQSILQAGNLYAYCISNPVLYSDPTGNSVALAADTIASLSTYSSVLVGGISAAVASISAAIASSWTVIGAIAGITIGAIILGSIIYHASNYIAEAELTKSWALAQIRDGGISKNRLSGHSVYIIYKKGTDNVYYVGRTSNFSARQRAHQKGSGAKFPEEEYIMMVVATGLTLENARALEQTLITAFTLKELKNVINSIAESKHDDFTSAFIRMESLIRGYFDD